MPGYSGALTSKIPADRAIAASEARMRRQQEQADRDLAMERDAYRYKTATAWAQAQEKYRRKKEDAAQRHQDLMERLAERRQADAEANAAAREEGAQGRIDALAEGRRATAATHYETHSRELGLAEEAPAEQPALDRFPSAPPPGVSPNDTESQRQFAEVPPPEATAPPSAPPPPMTAPPTTTDMPSGVPTEAEVAAFNRVAGIPGPTISGTQPPAPPNPATGPPAPATTLEGEGPVPHYAAEEAPAAAPPRVPSDDQIEETQLALREAQDAFRSLQGTDDVRAIDEAAAAVRRLRGRLTFLRGRANHARQQAMGAQTRQEAATTRDAQNAQNEAIFGDAIRQAETPEDVDTALRSARGRVSLRVYLDLQKARDARVREIHTEQERADREARAQDEHDQRDAETAQRREETAVERERDRRMAIWRAANRFATEDEALAKRHDIEREVRDERAARARREAGTARFGSEGPGEAQATPANMARSLYPNDPQRQAQYILAEASRRSGLRPDQITALIARAQQGDTGAAELLRKAGLTRSTGE